jgi:hypothetical protein
VITFQNWTRPPHWPRLLCKSQLHLWLNCLTTHTFVPCPQFFCLFKPVAQVCTPKMAEDDLSAHSELCNKPPLFALTRPLYLAFMGGCLDLACGISWVLPWVQNSSFIISRWLRILIQCKWCTVLLNGMFRE